MFRKVKVIGVAFFKSGDGKMVVKFICKCRVIGTGIRILFPWAMFP